MLSPSLWWAIAGVVLMLGEFIVPGLVLVFFGFGALFTALLILMFSMSISVQLIIFALSSLVFLFGLRRLLRPVFSGRSSRSENGLPEGMVGQAAVVIAAIKPGEPGKVMLNGTVWKADSAEGLSVGQAVVVVAQRSLTVIVKAK